MTEIKAYTKKELSYMYGIGHTTFWQWCRAANLYDQYPELKRRIILPPSLVAVIFETFGSPVNKPLPYQAGQVVRSCP